MDFAKNFHLINNNDLYGQTLWVSPKQITTFPDSDILTPSEKPSMVAESPKITAVKPNMVSVSSQTEVKIEPLQSAWTEIHNMEPEEKCYGLQRDNERQKRIIHDLEKKLQIKTKESQMHKDSYKTIRNDHVETHVLVSKDLKHMQAMVETSELRRAEGIKMIQTIPAKCLKPYQKSLENMLSNATEAKRKFYRHNSLFSLKEGNLKPYLGYAWLPDGNREEIEEWCSKYPLPIDIEKILLQ